MDNTFSYDLRVLLCPQCGAPIEAKPEGGLFKCNFCGVNMMLGSRLGQAPAPPAAPAAPTAPAGAADDEGRRLEALRAQDGKPLMPPPNLRYLMSLGLLSEDHLELALKEWQAARGRLVAQPTAADAEQLYFLTLMLYQYYSSKREVLRIRALLETASELLANSRYMDIVRCMLSRSAANSKDLEAAEKWLSLCNDRSADLQTDTEYRFSKAHLLTIKQQWPEVLKLLGDNLTAIPIADSSDAVCGMLRANALEKMGQLDQARLQIDQLVSKSYIGPQTLTHIMTRYQGLNLPICEQSFGPLAEKVQAAMKPKKFSFLRLLIRYLLPLAGVVALVLHFVSLPFLPDDDSFREAMLTVGITLIILSFSFALPGFFLRRFLGQSADRERLLKEGIAGKAEIVAVTPTGWTVNDVPRYKFELLITLPNQEPFRATELLLMKPDQQPNFQPGVTIGVKADPKNPKKFALLLG